VQRVGVRAELPAPAGGQRPYLPCGQVIRGVPAATIREVVRKATALKWYFFNIGSTVVQSVSVPSSNVSSSALAGRATDWCEISFSTSDSRTVR
jgi:hypothetical protein